MEADRPEQAALARCPVCATPDAQQWPGTGDGRKVDCGRCGPFEIAAAAAHVLDSHPTLREEASQLIGRMPRPAEGWLFISSYTLHELFPAELGPTNG